LPDIVQLFDLCVNPPTCIVRKKTDDKQELWRNSQRPLARIGQIQWKCSVAKRSDVKQTFEISGISSFWKISY